MPETMRRKVFCGVRRNIHLPKTVPTTTAIVATAAICHCEAIC